MICLRPRQWTLVVILWFDQSVIPSGIPLPTGPGCTTFGKCFQIVDQSLIDFALTKLVAQAIPVTCSSHSRFHDRFLVDVKNSESAGNLASLGTMASSSQHSARSPTQRSTSSVSELSEQSSLEIQRGPIRHVEELMPSPSLPQERMLKPSHEGT